MKVRKKKQKGKKLIQFFKVWFALQVEESENLHVHNLDIKKRKSMIKSFKQ